jgi:hypothetical protein
MAAILANMPQHSISRHAGGAKEQMQLQQTNSDSQHHNKHHVHSELHYCHLVTMRALTIMKSMGCHQGICIYMLLSMRSTFQS